MRIRYLAHFAVAASLAASCGTVFAGFDFLSGLKNVDTSKIGSMLGNATKAVREPDEKEEIAVGQEFAATLLGAKPLVRDEALQRYVNTLGRWLALQTERPDLPWTFGVLDDNGFNAFAAPGGYIFVTKGLVSRMQNESELAGVLAHEIGHVLKKHHLRAVKKNSGMAFAGDLFGTLTDNKGNEEAKAALMNISKKLYAKGLDKEDEFEADRLGVVIAARAGYDAYGLPAVLQMLEAQSAGDNNFSLLFKTHPAPSARIQMLDLVMGDRFDGLPVSTGKPISVRMAELGK